MLIPAKLYLLQQLTSLIEATEFDDTNTPEGSDFDLSGRVFRGRALIGHEEESYYVNIIDAPRQDPGITAGANQARRNSWELYVQVVNPDTGRMGTNYYDELYWLTTAVEAQLAKINLCDRAGRPMYPSTYRMGPKLSKFIPSVEVGPSLVRPPDPDANAHAFSFQSIVFDVAALVRQPYIEIEE